MKKCFVFSLVVVSTTLYSDGNWYLKGSVGLNFIQLKNDYFKKFHYDYLTQFRYRQSVGFPSVMLDIGFSPLKTFRFLRHDNNLIWGVKGCLSQTSKKIIGEIGFDDITTPALFLASHEYNIRSFCFYTGIAFNGEKTKVNLTGGVQILLSLLKKLSIYENTISQPYTGLYLNSLTPALAGTLGLSVQKEWNEDFFVTLGYEFTRGLQKYKNRLHVESAEGHAQTYLQELHLLQGLNEHHMEFHQSPLIHFNIHTLFVSIGYSF